MIGFVAAPLSSFENGQPTYQDHLAFDHVKTYRARFQPMLGSLIDERLQRQLKRMIPVRGSVRSNHDPRMDHGGGPANLS